MIMIGIGERSLHLHQHPGRLAEDPRQPEPQGEEDHQGSEEEEDSGAGEKQGS